MKSPLANQLLHGSLSTRCPACCTVCSCYSSKGTRSVSRMGRQINLKLRPRTHKCRPLVASCDAGDQHPAELHVVQLFNQCHMKIWRQVVNQPRCFQTGKSWTWCLPAQLQEYTLFLLQLNRSLIYRTFISTLQSPDLI